MKPVSRLSIMAAVAALLLAGCGITAPRSNEGYADLDSLGMFDVDNTTTISLGPTVLRLAARYMEDDPETRALIKDLDGVRVRIYEIDGDASKVAGRIDRMNTKLQDQRWAPVMVVREEGEVLYVLMKMSGESIAGLTVLTSDGSEAVIVNVMGDIKPEYFSETMLALDVDVAPEVQVVGTETETALAAADS